MTDLTSPSNVPDVHLSSSLEGNSTRANHSANRINTHSTSYGHFRKSSQQNFPSSTSLRTQQIPSTQGKSKHYSDHNPLRRYQNQNNSSTTMNNYPNQLQKQTLQHYNQQQLVQLQQQQLLQHYSSSHQQGVPLNGTVNLDSTQSVKHQMQHYQSAPQSMDATPSSSGQSQTSILSFYKRLKQLREQKSELEFDRKLHEQFELTRSRLLFDRTHIQRFSMQARKRGLNQYQQHIQQQQQQQQQQQHPIEGTLLHSQAHQNLSQSQDSICITALEGSSNNFYSSPSSSSSNHTNHTNVKNVISNNASLITSHENNQFRVNSNHHSNTNNTSSSNNCNNRISNNNNNNTALFFHNVNTSCDDTQQSQQQQRVLFFQHHVNFQTRKDTHINKVLSNLSISMTPGPDSSDNVFVRKVLPARVLHNRSASDIPPVLSPTLDQDDHSFMNKRHHQNFLHQPQLEGGGTNAVDSKRHSQQQYLKHATFSMGNSKHNQVDSMKRKSNQVTSPHGHANRNNYQYFMKSASKSKRNYSQDEILEENDEAKRTSVNFSKSLQRKAIFDFLTKKSSSRQICKFGSQSSIADINFSSELGSDKHVIIPQTQINNSSLSNQQNLISHSQQQQQQHIQHQLYKPQIIPQVSINNPQANYSSQNSANNHQQKYISAASGSQQNLNQIHQNNNISILKNNNHNNKQPNTTSKRTIKLPNNLINSISTNPQKI